VPRIMVIDDEAMVRQAVAMVLRLLRQWQTEEAKDGQDALARARANPPDLFLCDVNMPLMDGFETLAAVRADPVLKDVPFIMMSARMDRDNERRALAVKKRAPRTPPGNGTAGGPAPVA
jgi:CheY-like chemotaxis protein